jgi:hypothetical protein
MPHNLPRACQELAQAQEGVISRQQALERGMSSHVIDRRVRGGRWQALHHGVYSVFTGRPSREAVQWAAVLRAGSGAALSYESAAELFKLIDKPASVIHVTIPDARQVVPVPGVVIHRSARLSEALHPSLLPPRTRVEETVLDLAAQATTFDAALAIVCAGIQRGLTTSGRLTEAMSQRSRLRWRNDLAIALSDVGAGAHSLLEYRYLHRVERRHGLPTATRQAKVAADGRSRYLDNLYDEYGLCVELDGLAAHPDDRHWQDLRRINEITERGLTVLRYGWIDVDRHACLVAVQVSTVLRRLGWPGPARSCGATCEARKQATN